MASLIRTILGRREGRGKCRSHTVSAWVRPRGLTLFNGRWSDYWVAQAPVPDGEWTHVVATADQTIGRLRYYVNGRPAGGSSTLAPFLASTAPLFVGFQADDGVFYSGDVDDVRVWDRVLGAAEVEALFRGE